MAVTTITLPSEHEGRDGVVGGVQFTGGKASVDDLGTNAAAYFTAIGARLRLPKPKPAEGDGA